ncbi:MAG: cupredoxin domain-containing protein [Hyphomicrobiales bacterium]
MFRITRVAGLAVVIALFGIALVACGGDDDDDDGGSSGATGQTVTYGNFKFVDKGTAKAEGDEIELEADSYYFEPTFIQADAGKKVSFEIENESNTVHNFTVKSLGIDMDIPAGGKTTVEVTFPASGAVVFECKYHTGQGMNGELLAGDAKPGAPSVDAAPGSGSSGGSGASATATTPASSSSGYDSGGYAGY